MRKRFVAICTLSIVSLCLTVGTATAGYTTGNPKTCAIAGKAQTPSYCARRAAQLTLRAYMTRTTGKPWDADITCTPTSGLVRWSCTWKPSGTATVWFRGTSNGWKRVVTVTGNG